MTPSASASPIVLLAPAAAPAAVATSAESTAGIASGAPLDGGFQLLVDAASQQQLAAQLAANAPKSQGAQVPAGDGDPAAAAGNVLPLPGLILPVDDAMPADGEQAAKKTEGSDEGDAAPASTAATTPAPTIPVPWVPVNIQPSQQPAAKAPGKHAAAEADATIDTTTGSGVATAAAASASMPANPLPGATADDAAAAADDGIRVGASGMSIPAPSARQPSADRGVQASADALAGSSTDAAKSALPGDAAAARKGDVTSFADALKPAVAAAADGAQPQAPTAGVVDAGRHAPTRSYADISGAASTATVSVPVGSSGWSDAVVDKVMWFSANQINSAEIKLNPPDLGPLQVRISTQHDQTSVVFSSPHAAVRDALDQALPRLRDMFGGQGLQLSDASVGGQAQRQQQQQPGDNGASGQNRGSNWFGNEEGGDTPVAVTRVVGSRLASSAVDAYA